MNNLPLYDQSSNVMLEKELYAKNRPACEISIVRGWLQDMALEPSDMEIQSTRWLYTRENIRLQRLKRQQQSTGWQRVKTSH